MWERMRCLYTRRECRDKAFSAASSHWLLLSETRRRPHPSLCFHCHPSRSTFRSSRPTTSTATSWSCSSPWTASAAGTETDRAASWISSSARPPTPYHSSGSPSRSATLARQPALLLAQLRGRHRHPPRHFPDGQPPRQQHYVAAQLGDGLQGHGGARGASQHGRPAASSPSWRSLRD
jgi:hypothetical protein